VPPWSRYPNDHAGSHRAMETGTSVLPSGQSIYDLLDWRPDLGVVTVGVAAILRY